MIFTSADMRPGTKYSFLNQHSIQTRKTLKDHSQQIIYTMKWALPILFVWPCGQNKHSIFSNEPHMIRPCLVTCQKFIKIEYQNWNLKHFALYCCMPPTQELQVTVAWGHRWRAPKRAANTRWLKPPTYWVAQCWSGCKTDFVSWCVSDFWADAFLLNSNA